MGKGKAKVIQIDLGIFTYIQTYSGITQAFSEPCVIQVYSESCHMQNSSICSEKEA